MYSINITDAAEQDILSTVNYIAAVLKVPVTANNLLDELEKCEKILEETPNIYPFVPDEYLAEKGFKFVMVKNYILFFIVDEDDMIVNVVRFLYGRRDWRNILTGKVK
jgi:plasmid stabilization system protein ParE